MTLACPNNGRQVLWSGNSGTSRQGRGSDGSPRIASGTATLERFDGSVGVTFGLDLALFEPLTGEKLWLKSVKPTASNEDYAYYTKTIRYEFLDATIGQIITGEGRRRQVGQPEVILLSGSDTRPNALAAALEKLFGTSLNEFSRYFDPKEIREVVKDAERVRKLKRY
jgi:hypothetical protein